MPGCRGVQMKSGISIDFGAFCLFVPGVKLWVRVLGYVQIS